jgi:hypothetical protein
MLHPTCALGPKREPPAEPLRVGQVGSVVGVQHLTFPISVRIPARPIPGVALTCRRVPHHSHGHTGRADPSHPL